MITRWGWRRCSGSSHRVRANQDACYVKGEGTSLGTPVIDLGGAAREPWHLNAERVMPRGAWAG
jgi:hypothetical protein